MPEKGRLYNFFKNYYSHKCSLKMKCSKNLVKKLKIIIRKFIFSIMKILLHMLLSTLVILQDENDKL